MSEDKKSSIKISKNGIEISTNSETVDRAANQFLDLVSLFSEPAGTIGDTVRMYRQENAIKGLSRATQLAKDKGIDLRPVAPKFLVNWVEKVSLEDDPDISDLWAKLLVSEVAESKPSHHFFMRILNEFTGRQAKLLSKLCEQNGTVDFSSNLIIEGQKNLNIHLGSLEIKAPSISNTEPKHIYPLTDSLIKTGITPYLFMLKERRSATRTKDCWDIFEGYHQSFYEDNTIQHLINLGILNEFEYYQNINHRNVMLGMDRQTGTIIQSTHILQIKFIQITKLGRNFLTACTSGDASNA